MSTKEETLIQSKCQKVLRNNEAFVYKTHGDAYTRPGIPDLIACLPVTEEDIKRLIKIGWFKDNKIGLFVGIENKTPSKISVFDDTRISQEIVGAEITRAGGTWYVLDDEKKLKSIIKIMKGDNNVL